MQVVLDWDGTVTEVDTLHLVLERFGDPGEFERAEAALGCSLTLHEVIAREFRTVRAPLAEVVAWLLGAVRVRPGFRELAQAHRPVILSSGFRELIDPVLHREGIELEVLANRVEARADGWRVHFRDEALCATCGEACKRGSLLAGDVVYVGDGYWDHCAALAAGRVFATAGLALYLDEQGAPYEPFTDLHGVARALDSHTGR